MRVVVDTSVFLKVWVKEEGSDEAEALFRARTEGRVDLAAPEFGALEFVNVLWRHERRGLVSRRDVDRIVSGIPEWGVDWWPAADLLGRSLAIARATGQGVYDGAFLALAEEIRAPLVTADERLLAIARSRFGFLVPLRQVPALLGS